MILRPKYNCNRISSNLESRDTVKSFSLIVFVKTISRLNMEHGVKSEKGTELENYPSRLTLSRQRRMWTYAILQMTAKIAQRIIL